MCARVCIEPRYLGIGMEMCVCQRVCACVQCLCSCMSVGLCVRDSKSDFFFRVLQWKREQGVLGPDDGPPSPNHTRIDQHTLMSQQQAAGRRPLPWQSMTSGSMNEHIAFHKPGNLRASNHVSHTTRSSIARPDLEPLRVCCSAVWNDLRRKRGKGRQVGWEGGWLVRGGERGDTSQEWQLFESHLSSHFPYHPPPPFKPPSCEVIEGEGLCIIRWKLTNNHTGAVPEAGCVMVSAHLQRGVRRTNELRQKEKWTEELKR